MFYVKQKARRLAGLCHLHFWHQLYKRGANPTETLCADIAAVAWQPFPLGSRRYERLLIQQRAHRPTLPWLFGFRFFVGLTGRFAEKRPLTKLALYL